MRKISGQSGFSLIELMIVVAIVAVLAMVAMPSYQEYIMRAKRADGTNKLLDIANRQQQYFLDNRAYGTATQLGLVQGACTANLAISEENNYCITITIAVGSYTLSAAPMGAQTQDTDCASINYNSAGQKGSNGTFPDNSCWGG